MRACVDDRRTLSLSCLCAVRVRIVTTILGGSSVGGSFPDLGAPTKGAALFAPGSSSRTSYKNGMCQLACDSLKPGQEIAIYAQNGTLNENNTNARFMRKDRGTSPEGTGELSCQLLSEARRAMAPLRDFVHSALSAEVLSLCARSVNDLEPRT